MPGTFQEAGRETRRARRRLRLAGAALAGLLAVLGARAQSPDDRAGFDTQSPGAHPAPVWFTSDGPRPAVDAALRELRNAAERGLAPEDYGIDALERQLAAAVNGMRQDEATARADLALTTTFLRYLSDLRSGRFRERQVESDYRGDPAEAVSEARLREAVQGDRLAAMVALAEPAFPQYARLRQLLTMYRALAAQSWPTLAPLPTPRGKVETGDRYAGVPALRAQLQRLGDLAVTHAQGDDDRYSDELAEGVRRFQARHGLLVDGILGKDTFAALNEPMAARVSQIELSLERLRWLPELPPGPLIAINIPSFQLVAFADSRRSWRPTLSMPVVVGKAVRHQTPAFVAAMRYLEFSPYWNVPRSILTRELLPRMASDPDYLAREDMEIVSTRDGATIFEPGDEAGIAALRSGDARLRQRPGPRNALGGVKFVLPNEMDIYLHSTPARELFERTRRDFSHGCIRVRDPIALAQFVLGGQAEWTPAGIEAAMASGVNRIVPLAAPIPVVIFYTTAIVDSEGRARFLPDIYGHDRRLLQAMGRAGDARSGPGGR